MLPAIAPVEAGSTAHCVVCHDAMDVEAAAVRFPSSCRLPRQLPRHAPGSRCPRRCPLCRCGPRDDPCDSDSEESDLGPPGEAMKAAGKDKTRKSTARSLKTIAKWKGRMREERVVARAAAKSLRPRNTDLEKIFRGAGQRVGRGRWCSRRTDAAPSHGRSRPFASFQAHQLRTTQR